MTAWIDTHCHLDAPEFSAPDAAAVRARAAAENVALCVIPAVSRWRISTRCARWPTASAMRYALGIHPLYVAQAGDGDAGRAGRRTGAPCRADPRLVAVGEIGLDLFVPELARSAA
jgi:TatD DNase family protein